MADSLAESMAQCCRLKKVSLEVRQKVWLVFLQGNESMAKSLAKSMAEFFRRKKKYG